MLLKEISLYTFAIILQLKAIDYLIMLDGLINVTHFLCGKFSKALDHVNAMFNAQIQVWCQIQQSRHWLYVTMLTFGTELHGNDCAMLKRCLKWNQMTHYWLIVTHL